MPSKLKRKRTHLKEFKFKKGVTPYNKGKIFMKVENKQYVRINSSTNKTGEELNNLINQHDIHGNATDVQYQLLRERPNSDLVNLALKTESDRPNMDNYKLFHAKKLEDLFDHASKEHFKLKCDGKLLFDEKREKQWGVVWQEGMYCKKCNYKSEMFKLYEEVESEELKKGRKAAKPNVGLILGLMTTSIAYRPICDILANMNISPPDLKSMNQLANKISDEVVNLSKDEMSKIRKNIKLKKEAIGDRDPESIRAEGDGRFNNRFGDTPFQPATQAVYTVLENETDAKKVIAISTVNKLCKRGQIYRLKDKYALCPNHPGKCTATLPEDGIIGDEEKLAADCVGQINEDRLNIRYFTADGDSKAFHGIQRAQSGTVEYLRDIRHMANSLKRAIVNKPFSATMFLNCTAPQQQTLKRRFASDVRARCISELYSALEHHNGNINKAKLAMPNVCEAIIMCYKGYCGDCCQKYSFTCKGLTNDRWLRNYMPRKCSIRMNAYDESLLEECLHIFLSPQVIPKMRFLTNTQATEAFNRRLNRVNPKDVTLSRNYLGRVHTAALMKNHGFSGCTVLRCSRLGATLAAGSRVIKYLHRRQRKDNYDKARQNSQKYKQRRSELKFRKYRLHENKNFASYYSKDLADKCERDHNYAKNE